jgi:membrane protein DedA with SNARE-associated domain
VTDWVIDVINALGYVGLAAMMLLECVFPPIPSEVILPFAGFAVGEGDMSFPIALGAATAGSVMGNVALYIAARRGGLTLVARHGRRVGATPERLARLEAWMDRWGSATVLVGRAIPLARSTVSLPAGLARFPVWRFLLLTTLGSAAWNGVLIGLGWALGDAWHTVEERMSGPSLLIAATLVAGAVVLVLLARRRARRAAAAAAGPSSG